MFLVGMPASARMQATFAIAEAPSEDTASGSQPELTPDPGPDADVDALVAPESTPAAGPIVHILNVKPDQEYGPIKLAKHRATTAAAAGNALLITTHYDEICTEPCAVAVDVSERPIFFFTRDGKAISYGFRLNNLTGDVTLTVRPLRSGLYMGGVTLTTILILPAGIPMIIFGKAKVSMSIGAPAEGQVFKKVKRAKT